MLDLFADGIFKCILTLMYFEKNVHECLNEHNIALIHVMA